MDKLRNRMLAQRQNRRTSWGEKFKPVAGALSAARVFSSQSTSGFYHLATSSYEVMDEEEFLKNAMGAEKLGEDGGFSPQAVPPATRDADRERREADAGLRRASSEGLALSRIGLEASGLTPAQKQRTAQEPRSDEQHFSTDRRLPRSNALSSVRRATGPFDDPRSGRDRRSVVMPSLIPTGGCRRKHQRRLWRSGISASKNWWMLRGFLRKD